MLIIISVSLVGCGKDSLAEAEKFRAEGVRNDDVAALEAAVKEYEESWQTALKAVEGIYEAQLLIGIKLAEAGNYTGCLERLAEAEAIRATEARLYYYQGLCAMNLARTLTQAEEKLEYTREADAAFTSGFTYDPMDPLLYYGQGILYGFVWDRVEEGVNLLERSYELEPYDVNVLFALANLYYRMNSIERSQKFYREIMDKTPSQSEKWLKAQENLAIINSQ